MTRPLLVYCVDNRDVILELSDLCEIQPGYMTMAYYPRVTTATTRHITGLIRGRTVRHWTPHYVYARLREMHYERAHPDHPWITSEAIRLLASMLRPDDVGAEFGSGRSTLWLARRCQHLTSVEHDLAWHRKISAAIREQGLTNVDYLHHPRDLPEESGDMSDHARVALSFDDESIDFVLVDGVYRDHVTRLVMPKIKPGGMLIIDNINWCLASPTRAPYSRTPQTGHKDASWDGIARDLASWRTIWTTSGVTDTAIFVKA
jgi:predicted O-methyltransferase YrrM